ncbi:MAG: methyltransferase [Patescibacteria group bacterium]
MAHRAEQVLYELLKKPGIDWRLCLEDGSMAAADGFPGGRLHPGQAGELAGLISSRPDLILLGRGEGRLIRVRRRRGGLAVEMGGPLPGGCPVLPGSAAWPRVPRRVLAAILTAAHPWMPGAGRQRLAAAAAFCGRLLALLGGASEPFILDCGAGPAPISLALLAALGRQKRRARLVCLDASGQVSAKAKALAAGLGLEAEFITASLDSYRPDSPPDLVLAVHACGGASLDAVELGLSQRARALALVPCCAPPGSALTLGLPAGLSVDEPLLAKRLDLLGLVHACRVRLRAGGYAAEAFEVFLPPWRTSELAVAAYPPAARGQNT